MPTSKAERLNKLFQDQELPPLPDPYQPHIADTELVSKMHPAPQQAWAVPKVAQQPRVIRQSPPRTGQGIDEMTSSDDDEYVRAFKKTPAIRAESKAKPKKPDRASSTKDAQGGSRVGPRLKTAGHAGVSELWRRVDTVDPPVGKFCPFLPVTKFCYKYMDDPSDRVSKHFFASGKIWNRTWDIYYIYPPASMAAKPILLVPEHQVQNLIDEINSAFKISISLPSDPFLLDFGQDGTPTPALLGTTRSREEVAEKERMIPTPPEDHGECLTGASPEVENAFDHFREKMERVVAAGKKKAIFRKRATAKDRLVAHIHHGEALKRGQRYLGLRPIDCKGDWPIPDTSTSWDEQQVFERAQMIKYGHLLLPLDANKPAPCIFDRNVVFVAIDIEAYERNHSLITEVGISTLDTADIQSLPPGQGGANWMHSIRSRHFRIRDHVHLRNTAFCIGDPDRFLFGRSEFVSLGEVGKYIDSCFQPPYSRGFGHDDKGMMKDQQSSEVQLDNKSEDMMLNQQRPHQDTLPGQSPTDPIDTQGRTNVELDLANQLAVSNLLPPGDQDGSKQASSGPQTDPPALGSDGPSHIYRNVILVGHDLEGDLDYLSTLKSATFPKPAADTHPQGPEAEHPLRQHILEAFDTARLYQAWKGKDQIASLAKALLGTERPAWGLHNGGNDARYTMEVLIGILVRSRVEGEEKKKKK